LVPLVAVGTILVFWAFSSQRPYFGLAELQSRLSYELAARLDQKQIDYSIVQFDFMPNAPQVQVNFGGLTQRSTNNTGETRFLKGEVRLDFTPPDQWKFAGTQDLSGLKGEFEFDPHGYQWWTTPPAQSDVSESETNKPGDWIWEPNSSTLAQVPPMMQLRPTTFPTNYVPFGMFGNDRYMAQRQTVKDLIKTVWSQKNSALPIVYEADLPDDRYDFIVTADPKWWETLQSEIDRRFNLSEKIESRNGKDVVVVKAKPTAADQTFSAENGKVVMTVPDRVIKADNISIHSDGRYTLSNPSITFSNNYGVTKQTFSRLELSPDFAGSNPGQTDSTNAGQSSLLTDHQPPAVAEIWLKLIDDGKADESRNLTSTFFQSAVSQAQWATSLKTYREPLGNTISRKLLSSQRTNQMAGAPDGDYMVMQFTSSFANKNSAVETVTCAREDGHWKPSGYYVK
jgi:hypothetical protein